MSGKQSFVLAYTTRELVDDPMARAYYLSTAVLCLLSVATIGVVSGNLPSQIPLWFTFPWGEARLAPKIYLMIIPAIMVVVTIVNILVGKLLKNQAILLTRTLALANLVVAMMLIIALAGILQSIL